MASERLDREFRHVLRRCPKLTDAQVRLLAFVSSYSQGCLLTYDEICKLTNWSRSKLGRVIDSLVKCNLIEKKYGTYKKTKIKIAPAWRQSEFADASDVSSVTQEPYSIHEVDMGHPRNHDMSPVIQPILERKIETGDLEIGNGSINVQSLIAEKFPNWNRKIIRSS